MQVWLAASSSHACLDVNKCINGESSCTHPATDRSHPAWPIILLLPVSPPMSSTHSQIHIRIHPHALAHGSSFHTRPSIIRVKLLPPGGFGNGLGFPDWKVGKQHWNSTREGHKGTCSGNGWAAIFRHKPVHKRINTFVLKRSWGIVNVCSTLLSTLSVTECTRWTVETLESLRVDSVTMSDTRVKNVNEDTHGQVWELLL